jgi:hypothetical protein
VSALDDIYSPENIARSRTRAANMRRMVASGEIGPEWSQAADQIDIYADERESKATESGPTS